MTEPQTEYDTDAEPTRGRWIMATSNSYRRIVTEDMDPVLVPVTQSRDGHPDLHFPNGGYDGPDARLMIAAGTAADEIAEMGYDPVAAVEALPDLLRAAEALIDDTYEGVVGDEQEVRTAPSQGLVDKLDALLADVIEGSDALARAEGGRDA